LAEATDLFAAQAVVSEVTASAESGEVVHLFFPALATQAVGCYLYMRAGRERAL
jgi:hypothetical protein